MLKEQHVETQNVTFRLTWRWRWSAAANEIIIASNKISKSYAAFIVEQVPIMDHFHTILFINILAFIHCIWIYTNLTSEGILH